MSMAGTEYHGEPPEPGCTWVSEHESNGHRVRGHWRHCHHHDNIVSTVPSTANNHAVNRAVNAGNEHNAATRAHTARNHENNATSATSHAPSPSLEHPRVLSKPSGAAARAQEEERAALSDNVDNNAGTGDNNGDSDPETGHSSRSFRVSTASGKPLDVTVEYDDSMVDEHFEGMITGRKHVMLGTVTIRSDGKILTRERFDDDEKHDGLHDSTEYHGYRGVIYGDSGARVLVSMDAHDAIMRAIRETRAEGTSEDSKRAAREDAERARTSRLQAAKRVISMAESQKDIPTDAEKRERLAAYNDLYNEGGSGYLPSIISREDYDAAKRELTELTDDNGAH